MANRSFSKLSIGYDVPDLTSIQRNSYREFLQIDTPPHERKDIGLQAVLNETFPIESEQKGLYLECLGYTLGRPRFSPEECKQLGLTYGYPFHIKVRLHKKEETIEETVYLGDMPTMLGGGEFIINGAERVIVLQLHRSPGCDFSEERSGERTLHSFRLIPERGSWIEMEVGRTDVLNCKLDQSGKMPATLLLRTLSEDFAVDEQIIRQFYETEKISFTAGTAPAKLRGKISAMTVELEEGELTLVRAGETLTDEQAQQLAEAGLSGLEVLSGEPDMLIVNTLLEDKARDFDSAVKDLYGRLRPGTPFSFERAKKLIWDKFYDEKRYRLGEVGRFRMNRKLEMKIPTDYQVLRPEDVVEAIRYLMTLRLGKGAVDDIDHLGNRRVRSIGELAQEELRKGFLRLSRTAQERLNFKKADKLTPRSLLNAKAIGSSVNFFFGRGELSQIVDQTNPLSQLTHERRLSALGPGGLNRKRAGFDVRDVHISHYGRICPIETPEGTNVGLITSLGVYSQVDKYGFLVTPYRLAKKGKLTDEVHYLRADEERDSYIAPADQNLTRLKPDDIVMARFNGDFIEVPFSEVEYVDVSPNQIVGISASLIPFLEHSDANRALMGSNMQRQAVPLLTSEQPVVKTGLEGDVARNSSMVVKAARPGEVTFADASRVVIDGEDEYLLKKFESLNQNTCLNQKPTVKAGDRVKAGGVIADGASTSDGELALGKNLLTAFMPWEGYNFEDAILVSERVVKDDVFTSVHIESYETVIRETKLGKEEFTRDIANTSPSQLANLDEHGIVLEGTWVSPGSVLVGKVTPKGRSELTPEEKLLYAIFGKSGEDVKNESLKVPSGTEGVVVKTERFRRRSHLSEEERLDIDRRIESLEDEYNARIAAVFREGLKAVEEIAGAPVTCGRTQKVYQITGTMDDSSIAAMAEDFDTERTDFGGKRVNSRVRDAYRKYAERIEEFALERDHKLSRMRKGDELPSGVLEMVRVHVATKRKLGAGDKIAGRHGNKGVIARILPEEDMPFLGDGRPVDIVLNPLGVPSRMNVGQILETHLGWAARALGLQAVTPVFDGASEEEIRDMLNEAGLPEDGQTVLYDGRTGEPFDQRVTVGYMYILKLDHLIDEKVHARATGPYSLITQQPLGGKTRYGGQRFGEMEVWALEAYGAAHILQELLTVKSDDVDGRTKIYESMVKGANVLEAGIPVAFEVLSSEIKGLGLDLRLEKEPL